MALVRWDPAREMASLQSEVNRLLDTFFDSPGAAAANSPMRRWAPAMDLVEGEDHYLLKADLPGMDEGDVRIDLEDDTLTISGERKAEHTDAKDGYVRVERAFGAFQRSLTLPRGIDPDQITASFDRGVLEVRIPKPGDQRARRVSIQVGDRPTAIEGTSPNDAS